MEGEAGSHGPDGVPPGLLEEWERALTLVLGVSQVLS